MPQQAEEIVGLIGLCVTFLIVTWTAATVYLRKLELEHRGPRSLPDAVESRLERIEQAVDAIALEMERVSEGQRFTTKVLAERSAVPNLPSSDPTSR
jgi:hypothetical protein